MAIYVVYLVIYVVYLVIYVVYLVIYVVYLMASKLAVREADFRVKELEPQVPFRAQVDGFVPPTRACQLKNSPSRSSSHRSVFVFQNVFIH